MKNETLEIRARVHATRGPNLRHRNATLPKHGKAWNMVCKHENFSTKIWHKTAPKHGNMAPDAWNESRNMKWGTWNDLWLCKACIIWTWSVKTESRQSQIKHIYSLNQGHNVNSNRANFICKIGPEREIMIQVAAAGPKWPRSLQNSWRGAQN